MQQNIRAARTIAADHRASQWLQASIDRAGSGQRGDDASPAGAGLSRTHAPFAHRVARLFVGRASA